METGGEGVSELRRLVDEITHSDVAGWEEI